MARTEKTIKVEMSDEVTQVLIGLRRELESLNARLHQVESMAFAAVPAGIYFWEPPPAPLCSCPPNTVCANAACPHLPKVTC